MFGKAFVELGEGRIRERGKAGGQCGGSEGLPGAGRWWRADLGLIV